MNSLRIQMPKQTVNYFRLIFNVLKIQRYVPVCQFNTSVDTVDAFTEDLRQRNGRNKSIEIHNYSVQNNTKLENKPNVSFMSDEELDNLLLQLLSRNKNKQIEQIVEKCHDIRKFINEATLKKLFRHYSLAGKPEVVTVLQKYCAKVDPNLYRRNVEFLHYLAKAQCLKGNSDKGLSILKHCYTKYESRRSFYRMIFKELIQDSVLNRSEATLMIFKKYALEFSTLWGEHYPLVCFWYICWSSTWFSDQMLSNELLESSAALLEIVKDKATAFSITVLKEDYNEDAVTRLLQILLKYDMMNEYVKVLQVLFNYKLKQRDIRGCTEIIRNCETLGVNLPSNQQGQYIRMLIQGKSTESKPTTEKPMSKDFKLKF